MVVSLIGHSSPLKFILIALGLSTVALLHVVPTRADLNELALANLRSIRTRFESPVQDWMRIKRIRKKSNHHTANLAHGISTWLIPFALAGVFVAIFSYANPIINLWISELGLGLAFSPNPQRILTFAVIYIASWGFLRARTKLRIPPPALPHTATTVKPREAKKNATTAQLIIRCLVLFNLVFV